VIRSPDSSVLAVARTTAPRPDVEEQSTEAPPGTFPISTDPFDVYIVRLPPDAGKPVRQEHSRICPSRDCFRCPCGHRHFQSTTGMTSFPDGSRAIRTGRTYSGEPETS